MTNESWPKKTNILDEEQKTAAPDNQAPLTQRKIGVGGDTVSK